MALLQIIQIRFICGMQGIKRKRRCEIECKEHILAIQSLKANSSKYDIKLLFCPKFQRQPLPPEHTYPQYNNDGKFYTSAFILGVDRRVLLKNQQQELMDHQKQIRDSLEKHNQLIFPRPTSKHSLCSVCKQHYKNYYYHISSEQHREKIAQSQYNRHIKELCNIYIDQWEGAQERADEEAEKWAAKEEVKRQQVVEMAEQENEEDSESLLDVQRGEQQDNDGDEEDIDAAYNAKSSKKYVNNNFKDDDTIPFTARTTKRSAPEGRIHTSQYLRKKFISNNPVANQNRAQRQRQQRRYERQRDKIKSQRDNPENPKEFIKADEKERDIFIIMKAVYAINQSQVQFVWKRTSEKLRKELERDPLRGEIKLDIPQGSFQKYEKESKKYEIEYDLQGKFDREQRQEGIIDAHSHEYYLHPPPFAMSQYKEENNLRQYKKGDANGNQQRKTYQFYENIQKGDRKYPYYFHPYMYSPIYEPNPRSDFVSGHNQKEKLKNGQKSFDYPSVPQWPYPPPPYYYFPSTTKDHSEQKAHNYLLTSSSPYSIQKRYQPQSMSQHQYVTFQSSFASDQPNGKEKDLLTLKNKHKKDASHKPIVLHKTSVAPIHYQRQLPDPNAQPYQFYSPYPTHYRYPPQPQSTSHS